MADRQHARRAVFAGGFAGVFTRVFTRVFLAAGLLVVGGAAFGADRANPDVETLIAGTDDHAMPIDRLTVAPSGAWVTRTLSADELVQAVGGSTGGTVGLRVEGDQTVRRVWVLGLPAGLDGNSLRVSGSRVDTEAGVRVERETVSESPRYQRLDRRLAEVEAEARAVAVAVEENALRRGIARDQLASLVPGEATLSALWRDDGPVADLMTRLSQARVDLIERQARLSDDRRRLQAALDEMKAEPTGWRVGVTLTGNPVDSASKSEVLRLEYRVENAGWEPIYRAALDTGERQVSWRMTARVHQQTGEDWPAAPMTLVTSDQRQFHPVPSLSSLTVGFVDPEQGGPVRPLAKSSAMLAESAPMARGATVEDPTGFATEIAINKPSVVPSGDGGVNLAVLDQRLDAELALRVAPQMGREAVVVASFAPSIVHPLPAGRWEVFRDGQQQAGQSVGTLAPDEPVELSFGVDPRLVIDYDQPPDERAEHGVIGKFRQIERVRKVTLTSRHERAVPVTVLMRLPTALDADIVVEPLASTSEPDERAFEGQKGVWAYRRELVPDTPWQIDFAYRVRWPEEKRISPF
ncbi:MAG: mucoidy inhibitor MuiA family protein [Halothiobacillaceae bacterium]|nr:mucoidy inhibitor MuiA family protein [Halothiobacillaceae bacterium]